MTVAVTDEAEFESATAKAKADKLAELRAAGETREIHFDVMAIATGVARYENFDEFPPAAPPALDSHMNKWDRYKTFSEPPTLTLVEEPAAGGASHLVPPQSETYISVTIDGDPGQIEEGRYAVENGAVVLSDYRDIRIASLPLLQLGQDPMVVTRNLLRQTRQQATDFYRPLRYPDLGVA